MFLLIALVLLAAAGALLVRALTLSRSRTLESLSQVDSYGYTQPLADASVSKPTVVGEFATRLGDVFVSRLSPARESQLRNQLVAAGFYSLSPRKFMGYRVFATLGLPLLFLILQGLKPSSIIVLPLAAAGGWFIPVRVLKMRAKRRLREIDRQLPDLIDVLVVTIEAGLGFSASIQEASQRLGGPLGQEIRLMIQEQRMGLSTHEGLRNMLQRCDTPAMRSFVRAVLQGETLGVSIGQIMRSLAVEMRKRRKAAAEERAQKAPVKILFPLILLIFPAMFIVILFPAMYTILRSFGG